MCRGVCVCAAEAGALSGKREHGETEKREKKGGGWRAQNLRQIDGAQLD